MKILLLTHYYPPEVGAPQKRWAYLVEYLTGRGHQVAVCAPVPHYPLGQRLEAVPVWRWTPGERGESILRVPFVRYSHSMAVQMLDQAVSSVADVLASTYLRGCPPDVVVSTTPGLPMLCAGDAVARMLKLPHVAEIRDAWPDLIWESQLVHNASKGLLPRAVSRWVETRALPAVLLGAMKRAAAVIVTTDSFKQLTLSRGVPHVELVRNAAQEHPRHVVTQMAGELNLLYVGTVGRSQGLHHVIDALRGLSNVRLRVVGEGAAKAELQRQAVGMTNVEFFPQTVGAPLEALWEWADSGVVSLDAMPAFESTVPSKLYSVMARGIHVTGIVAGEAAHIIRQTHAGHTVKPGDVAGFRQLCDMLAHSGTAVTDEAARWVADHASVEAAGQKLETILAEVTA